MSSSQSDLTDLARRDSTSGLPVRSPAAAAAAGRAGSASPGSNAVRRGKVQPPPLRTETLERPRLLEWLNSKMNSRLVLVVAEAGSGKTTLLADFSRRTRLRTLWYRLDETDRGWAPFITHLVMAGRQYDPQFAPTTTQLLRELGPGGPTVEAVCQTFLRELSALTATGSVLIVDDFHLVDDSDEVVWVMQQLVTHGPERFGIVLASRRLPTFPIARLRLLGEVAELSSTDLRFDTVETASLFADTYRRPLDGDSVAELTRRTEGWAASLQLVEAATRGRTGRETRAFIHSLSAAEGQLYEFLAEEVVGHLPAELQDFLMRVSLVQTVDTALASVASDQDPQTARHLLLAAERSGLLSRSTKDRRNYRFHPLVRDFLQARLRRELGDPAIRELHRLLGDSCVRTDWQRAAFHFGQAGEAGRAIAVMTDALGIILAGGSFESAELVATGLAFDHAPAPMLVVSSRSAYRSGHDDAALVFAREAIEADPKSEYALLNLMSLSYSTGDLGLASDLANRLAIAARETPVRRVAELQLELLGASLKGSLPGAVRKFLQTAGDSHRQGHPHYEGIALVNAAVILRSMGEAREAADCATRSLGALEASSAGPERASARMVRSWALAHDGSLEEARTEAGLAVIDGGLSAHSEIFLELCDIETWYGEASAAHRALEAVAEPDSLPADQAEQRSLSELALALRLSDLHRAAELVGQVRLGQASTAAAMECRRLALLAQFSLATRDDASTRALDLAVAQASVQGAGLWSRFLHMAASVYGPPVQANSAIRIALQQRPTEVGVHAEQVIRRLDELDQDVRDALENEIRKRPDRWRECIRSIIQANSVERSARLWAGRILDQIGTKADVPILRKLVRTVRATGGAGSLGRGLARRLADPVFIHDMNRVSLAIGARHLQGGQVRRKALALLCFLISRRDFAATRDEVIEALWPDSDPTYALNSLNQTAYFLRRVLEPDFAEDQSPGYISYQADVVWLDQSLVRSATAGVQELIAKSGLSASPVDVEALSKAYRGRFALDFAYEDWATDYRESLHAGYLSVIEGSIAGDLASGHFGRGVTLARKALEVDAAAHQIELLLVRLYRLMGAHAAAAEQYQHYAAFMREELGVEVEALDAL